MEKSLRKKGIVFTLDVTIALILVIAILLLANFYINKAKGPALAKLQLVKRGSDILLQLNQQNVLDTLDPAKISYNLTNTIPRTYDMSLLIYNITLYAPGYTISIGNPIPETSRLGSGKMVFALSEGKIIRGYYTVRYYIWPK